MKRRSFLQTPIAAAVTLGAASHVMAETETSREWYNLLTYTLKPAKKPQLEAYLRDVFLPIAKRLTSAPVGVFVEDAEDVSKIVVLTIHTSPESAATVTSRLRADASYQESAAAYLAAKPDDPVYTRIEGSILKAIDGMPKLAVPDTTRSRLLNLRIYESHNERAGQKKIEMFNEGELAIFKRVGLEPVFFAETIVGTQMPNLTYMLVFPDDAARNAAWNQFRADPEWLKLKAIPEYSDKEILVKVTNRLLTPASYSQI